MFESLPPHEDASYMSDPATEMVRFIHECCTDESGRVMAVAVEVLSLWQMAGTGLMPQPPGFLLLNMAESDPDPFGRLGVFNNGGGTMGPPDLAKGNTPDPVYRRKLLETMRELTEAYQNLPANLTPECQMIIQNSRIIWGRYRDIVFGTGRSDRYAARWDEQMGLITDETRSISLLIHSEDDLELFRHHVKNAPDFLMPPVGCVQELGSVSKTVSVAGSLQPAQLDDALLAGILEHGLPVILLPHASVPQFEFIRNHQLWAIARTFTSAHQQPRPAPPPIPASLPNKAFPIREYERILRARSHHLPPDYEFYLQRTIRELGLVCLNIAFHGAGAKDPQLTADLCEDLHHLTMRGLVTGVESLAYHGWGFDAGIPRAKVAKLLAILRVAGGTTLRDVQRKFRELDAESLRTVLTTLSHQGLVVVDGKQVTAVGLRDFVDAIPRRSSLPPVVLATTSFMKEIRRNERGKGHR